MTVSTVTTNFKKSKMEEFFENLSKEELQKHATKFLICAKTGVYLRQFYETFISKEDDENFMKLFADANGLKSINDTRGHDAGDEYIKKIADIINKFTRPEDILVRWGGDEFILFIQTKDESVVQAVMERIECALKSAKISAALGTGKTIEEADKRMYVDKMSKKGFVYKIKQKIKRLLEPLQQME